MLKIAAIILAAGRSVRMGKPKPMVQFGGKTFFETVYSNIKNAGIENIVTVLGFAADEVAQKLELQPACYIVNKNYFLGQFSSFQAGLRKLHPNHDGVIMALVDQPQIHTIIIKHILEVFAKNPNKIIVPTCDGKRGHPPIFPKDLFSDILSAPPSQTAADIIHQHPTKTIEVEVYDDCVLGNINTKEDLQKALKKYFAK